MSMSFKLVQYEFILNNLICSAPYNREHVRSSNWQVDLPAQNMETQTTYLYLITKHQYKKSKQNIQLNKDGTWPIKTKAIPRQLKHYLPSYRR
jgi:hypothetical protein